MKAAIIGNNGRFGPVEVKVTIESQAELDALVRARRDVKKADLARGLGGGSDHADVRNVNGLLMVVGTVLDDDDDRTERAFDHTAPRRRR